MFEKINYSENVRSAKEDYIRAAKDAEYHKTVADLMNNRYIQSIRSYHTDWIYLIPSIRQAQEELLSETNGTKDSVIFLNMKVKNEFFGFLEDSVSIESIMSCNLSPCDGGEYAWEITFELNGRSGVYAIYIPVRENLNCDNLQYAYEGRFAFARKEDCCTTIELIAYEPTELAKQIEEHFAHETVHVFSLCGSDEIGEEKEEHQ